MARTWFRATIIMAVVAVVGIPLKGIYIGVEARRVPVARLAANLEKQLAASPRNPDLHVKLARLYGMAYSVNSEDVPATTDKGGKDEVWFGHEPNLVPHANVPVTDQPRTDAARNYLKKSIEHYRAALEADPENQIARLGYGWTLQESGDKPGAIAAYRAVIHKAWPKEQSARFAEWKPFFTVEAGEYLIPLLDPKGDAQEIAELRSRISRLRSVPRPITPIAIPLHSTEIKRIVNLEAQVAFDADGSGQRRAWTWISADAGWLVYDAEGKGRIESALQWFGNVTFWVMWNNGYEALAALDDNGDGELTGAELRHLGIWHDRNADGTSDPGEVRPLAKHGIVAVSCRFTAGDGLLTAASSAAGVRFEDGRSGPTYDVILRPARSVSSPAPEF